MQTATIKPTHQENRKNNGGHPPDPGQVKKTKRKQKAVRSGAISIEQFLKLFI